MRASASLLGLLLSLSAIASATLLLPRDTASSLDDSNQDRIEKICFPVNSTQQPNMDAPCNKLIYLEASCMYGANYSNSLANDDTDYGVDDDTPELSPSSQQSCVCKSAFWDYVTGCSNCERLHGAEIQDGFYDDDYILSMSKAYCGATQTQDLLEFFGNYTESTTPPASAATTFSDVLGNKTAVSLYWTASGASTETGKTATATKTGTGASGNSPSATGSSAGAGSTGAASTVHVGLGISSLAVGVILGWSFLL